MAKKATKAAAEKETVKVETQAEVKETKAAAKTETKPATKTETKTTKTTKAAAKETVTATIEFGGKNTTVDSIVESIKEAYKAEGNKAAIKTLNIYIQPENNVAYYVINGKEEGKSVNF